MKRVSPTASSASSTSAFRSAPLSSLCRSGSNTLLRTDAHGISERPYSWKTSAISSGGSVTRLPRKRISPRVGANRPATHLSRVVLPQPDGPTTHANSPSSTLNVRSPTACVVDAPAPYVLPRCLISSIALLRARRTPAAVPREHPPLHEQEQRVEEVAEQSDQQDRGPHRAQLERVLRDEQHVAD